MGEICVDYACADCGDFFQSYTCNSEEELEAWERKHHGEVYYCEGCRTFTDFTTGKKVKVIFPQYGTYTGWKELFEGVDQYIRETKLGYKFMEGEEVQWDEMCPNPSPTPTREEWEEWAEIMADVFSSRLYPSKWNLTKGAFLHMPCVPKEKL